MGKMNLTQAYTYSGITYGPGEAEVPDGPPSEELQKKEDDYRRYLSEGGQEVPPVTPALGGEPHYDHRLRRPGNTPPPRDVLIQQGRGADVPASDKERDAAAKDAADRESGDKNRPNAGTALDTAGVRQTTRESAKGK
jgi:hypothetical protein